LKQVASKVSKSDWKAAPYFNEVATAHYWNRKPSEIGLCDPEDDPAVMLAYYVTMKTIEAYNSHLQQQEMERARQKGKRR
jgi:hypothetical protein